MVMINRLAAFWLVLFTVFALAAATPARADVISDYKAELDSIALEMRALAGEIERFKIQQRYCLPPYGPVKQPDTMLMQAYSARAEALNDKYNALKGSLQDFLKRNTWAHGRLQVAGKDPNDAGWWARWDNSRDKMIAERNAKRDALARAPERDCTPRAKPAIAVQPPAPLALPERPQIPPFNWPALPPHFCSELEKLNWRIANINPHWIREAEAAHAVARYRSQIESLVNDLVQADKPIPPALAEARRQAIADVREMDRIEKANAEFYRRFAAVPIIDCNPPPPKVEPPRAAVPAADPPPPAAPAEKFETGSKLDTIRNRAWAQLQAMDAAAKTCDLAAFDAAFRELERLLEEAKAARFAATGASEFSNVTPKDAEGLVEALKDMVRQRRFQRDDIVRRCGQRPPATPSQTGFIPPSDTKMRTIFDAHNQLRADYRLPGLSWDPALAAAAQDYAGVLARTGRLAHSPREGRGLSRENLSQGMLNWGPLQMIGNWLKERNKFRAGVYPDVSTTGRWEDVSHYTQMIWPQTTAIGCGMADGAGSRWLVCRYSPGGNKEGRPVGQVFADGPKTATPPGDVAPTNSGMPVYPRDLTKLPVGGGMTQIDPPPGPPPPPPTAQDQAPEGDEARHPLRDYFLAASDQHRKAWLAGDLNGQAEALAKMHYALQELLKRLRAARKAGPLSGVKPADVQKQIDELNKIYRTANEMSRPREPGEERG